MWPKLTREFAIVSLVSGTLVTLLYIPQGFILGLNAWQWFLFIFTGLPYDFAVGLVVGESLIKFDRWAKKHKWY